MRMSESFLPFTENLYCKRIRFDDKLDLIDKIIPIDDKTCLLIDRSRNFHLKVYSPEDEDAVSLKFPLPPYGRNSNPNVLYSVDYIDLFHFIKGRRISEIDVEDYVYSLDRERTKYIQFVYLGDSKLAVQLNTDSPVAILDLHQPKNPPVMLSDICGVKNLISVGNGCLAWYDRSENMVILYHMITQKRKILNFTERSIKELYCLKDHVIVAVSMRQIEILDYVKNKVIKSVGFINDAIIPDVVVHSQANIISYLEGFHIHILKTEKGRIKWENYYAFNQYDEFAMYRFISYNLIALKTDSEIHILDIDSKNVMLNKVIQQPEIGFRNESGLEFLCCEDASKDGIIFGIHPLGNNKFAVVECACREKFYSHGRQLISVFSLENFEQQVDSITFTVSKSIIFEEFRDQVMAVDISDDESFGMFITEKGRLWRVDLEDYSVKHIIELKGLIKRNELDIKRIDNIFVMTEERVIITIKSHSSVYLRIVILALDTLQVDFDSDILKEETDEEAEFHFYDVTRMTPHKALISFRKRQHNETLYNLGTFHDDYDAEYNGFVFGEYNLPRRNQKVYDRLWTLEDSSLIAMRHGENALELTFLDISEEKTVSFNTKTFRGQRFGFSLGEIIDVKFVSKDVACIQIKSSNDDEDEEKGSDFLVYNIKTDNLLNKFNVESSIVGSIIHCCKVDDTWLNMQKMMLFADKRTLSSGIILKRVKDLSDKPFDEMEIPTGIYGFGMTARNFKTFEAQSRALVYESDHLKNFICILKSPKFKLECLKVFQSAVGNKYHKYIYKEVFETIYG